MAKDERKNLSYFRVLFDVLTQMSPLPNATSRDTSVKAARRLQRSVGRSVRRQSLLFAGKSVIGSCRAPNMPRFRPRRP
jgi:hypothetical protein